MSRRHRRLQIRTQTNTQFFTRGREKPISWCRDSRFCFQRWILVPLTMYRHQLVSTLFSATHFVAFPRLRKVGPARRGVALSDGNDRLAVNSLLEIELVPASGFSSSGSLASHACLRQNISYCHAERGLPPFGRGTDCMSGYLS